MNSLLTIGLAFAVTIGATVASTGSISAPRLPASTLQDFCSGDTSYGPQPTAYCLHYANGVLDTVGDDCLPPHVKNSSELLRVAILAWLAGQQNKGVDLSLMSGADAVRAAIKDTFCPATGQ